MHTYTTLPSPTLIVCVGVVLFAVPLSLFCCTVCAPACSICTGRQTNKVVTRRERKGREEENQCIYDCCCFLVPPFYNKWW
eukprot:NODE_779_length_613_cov_237.580247_g770_i0.p1 GENE.NODE_779_length_613_cov_237.580247_g770_i0~~NODE_779_length_613_cov_237.580247_g770_i0.p1  ORF type:complete len:81 (+),score=18.44 NODE_779_length_613_cov_237.580247_g770_i0:177-419(+)